MSRKALVVGIDDYPFSPLQGCVNDATKIATLLKTNEDGSKNFDVRLETEDLTKDNLMDMLQQLFSGESEIALFYFSGHGLKNDTLGEYICTPDGTQNSPGIKLSDITEIISKSKCHNKIVILDSCFSGGAGNMPLLSDKAALDSGVTFLSACGKNECSLECDGSGVFTNLLVNALSGEAADLLGNISPGAIYAYVDKALSAWDQRPIFKTNVREFICLRKVNPPVSCTELKRLKDFFTNPEDKFSLDPSFEFTNSPGKVPQLKQPYAKKENVEKLQFLQKMVSIGLVQPINSKHMYFAAMNSKGCQLTPLGKYYLHLAQKDRI